MNYSLKQKNIRKNKKRVEKYQIDLQTIISSMDG